MIMISAPAYGNQTQEDTMNRNESGIVPVNLFPVYLFV